MAETTERPEALVEVEEDGADEEGNAAEEYDDIDDWVDPYEGVALEDLEDQMQQLERENMILAHETKVYKQYMTDHMETDGSDVTGDAQIEGVARRTQSRSERSSGFRRRSKNPSTHGGSSRANFTVPVVLSLTIPQKITITARIQYDLKNILERNEAASEKKIGVLRAELEESKMVGEETEKTISDLQREIRSTSQAPAELGGKQEVLSAERFIRFLEDILKARDLLTSKYRLKSAALLALKKTTANRLIQKEENGEMLQMVDFEQLKIANKKYQETIDERNEEMLRLKQQSGSVVSLLNTTKDQLQKLSLESDRLSAEIKSRTSILNRLEKEDYTVEQDRRSAIVTNKKLQKQLEDYEVPSVLEYVQQKEQVQAQRKDVATWHRRLEVAQQELNRLKTMWRTVTTVGGGY